MGFYTRHVERFQREGKWNVAYRNGGLSFLSCALGDDVLLAVNDLPDAGAVGRIVGSRKPIVLNLGFAPLRMADGTVVAPASYRVAGGNHIRGVSCAFMR